MEMKPSDYARMGDVSYFKSAALDDIISSRDDMGDSVLSTAVKSSHLECCIEIHNRCPSLIYQRSRDDRFTALHHAAWRGDTKMLEFLIAASAKTPFEDIESGEDEVPIEKKFIRMLDNYGESALDKTVIQERYEAAKVLIKADPGFDHGVNYTNTQTTLLRAVRKSYGQADNSSAVKIRRLLLQNPINSNYAHEALQDAILKDEPSTVLDIIKFCPECIKLVDSEGQNSVHIAAKSGHDKVLKAILKSISSSVLNAQDSNGNTPLHLAALGESASCTEALFYHPKVDITTKNKTGQHVEDAVHEHEKRNGIRLGVNENELKNQSDFNLVVCALIATISFTSGIMVPGGYISGGPDSGLAIFSKRKPFVIFIVSNTFALLFSLYAVFSHYCTRHLREKKDIEFYVNVATLCTLGAIIAIVAAFMASSYLVLAVSKRLVITVLVMCGTFFLLALWPLGKMFMVFRRPSYWI